MEGVLWKWTNYLSGWQPRWFILESGVLSYYKSQEDVNNGCKGSIKINACDIKVHPTDNTRLDLIIPGEQHYYVKAAQPQERQSWLIALGSAKAKHSQPQEPPVAGTELPADVMRTKRSELRLYCDLLMQQVHSVKQSITQPGDGDGGKVAPDLDKLNEATSLLSATCDTFIQTLDDVMKLVQDAPGAAESAMSSSPKRVSGSASSSRISVSRSNSHDKSVKTRQSSSGSVDGVHSAKSRQRSRAGSEGSHSDVSLSEQTSASFANSQSASSKEVTPLSGSQATDKKDGIPPLASSQSGSRKKFAPAAENRICENDAVRDIEPVPNGREAQLAEEMDSVDDFKDAIDSKIPTFFTVMKVRQLGRRVISPKEGINVFVDVHILDDGGVPIQPFLEACKELVQIFDKLNSTAFAPVKMDFAGNIRKIQQKQTSAISSSSQGFPSLQSMVLSEVSARQHSNSNSATVALLWLKRGLEFIRELLREVCSGGPDLAECASNAYGRTLKNYHGWVVRGVFAVAVKALPYRSEFLSHLAAGECDTSSKHYLDSLMSDMEVFLQHLNTVILTIDHFYIQWQLDMQEQV